MKTREVQGYYGSGKTPDTVYVYENHDGSRWYVVDDSVNVNKTMEEIEEGVWVEEISDFDTFTWNLPITSQEELEEAVED